MNVRKIRDRAQHYLAPDTAADADLSFEELRQFVAGRSLPSQDQLAKLAARIGLSEEELHDE